MNPLKKILVYANMLAENQPALARGVRLAEVFDAELKIVDVFDDGGGSDSLHRPMRNAIEIEKIDKLEGLCDKLFHRDLEFTFELLKGRPFLEIVREVVHTGYQLVIKTASLADATDVLGMMGPVDMRLARNCPCNVLLEAPNSDIGWNRILVAIDPHASSSDLNFNLLRMAKLMAKVDDGDIHVVSIWNVDDEKFLKHKLSVERLDAYFQEVESQARKNFNSILRESELQLDSSQIHFVKGRPSEAIVSRVESSNPDLLIMGTVGDAETKGLLMGNTADLVLRQVNCSVMAIKPSGLFRV